MAAELHEGCVPMVIILTQDETTVDGNGRKSLTPMYATFGNVRAQFRNERWARVLVGYIPKPNKNLRPAGMGEADWQRCKRSIFRASMNEMLAPVRQVARTGVKMEIPDLEGMLRTVTVVPVIAFASYDNPEMHRVVQVKDAYREMPMFCTMCAHFMFCNMIHVGQ